MGSELNEWPRNTHVSLWNSGTEGETTRILWGTRDEDKTKALLKLSRKEVSETLGIITGLSGLQVQLKKIGAPDNSVCRACHKEDEILDQFLCQCLTFSSNRS